MSTIPYKADQKLKLLVRDSGSLDGFVVFVDKLRFDQVADGRTHPYAIERPNGELELKVEFSAGDGGVSAIVDVTTPPNETVVERQSGAAHSYLVKAV